MRKTMLLLTVIMCCLLTGCMSVEGKITKLYYVDKYKVHPQGVEIWVITETGEDVGGKFIKHENVYSCEEENSRVVSICCSHGQIIYDEYLYFSEEEYIDYIKLKLENN